MTAEQALELATLGGARALGLADRIGALEAGRRADLVVVDVDTPHAAPSTAPVSTLVYASRGSDVRHVFVDGRHLVDGGTLTALSGLDRGQVVADAHEAARRLGS